jgi:hypothetical protein
MKKIKSNRWGFGIHSPFVYKLVTKVIYGNTILPTRNCAFPVKTKSIDRWRSLLIVRLIIFLKPKMVMVSECVPCQPEIDQLYINTQTGNKSAYLKGIHMKLQTNVYEKFVVSPEPDISGIELSDHSVWIIPDTRRPGSKELFLSLQNNPCVSITLEVKGTGIVIHNSEYQKQNYLIRGFCRF